MKRYSYKIRLYPNSSQREFLARQFGCCRHVYNEMCRKYFDRQPNTARAAPIALGKLIQSILSPGI